MGFRSSIRGAFVSAATRFNRYSPINLAFPDPLTRLANRFGSPKGSNLYPEPAYFARIYDMLFRSMRDAPLTILEIGLLDRSFDKRSDVAGSEGSSSLSAHTAPSLQMWRKYFPNANLFGFDIDAFGSVNIERCKIIQGDMSSRKDLRNLVQQIGGPIDLIIEDASHVSHHQQIAFGYLFPYIASGGYYIIEDLHWQDPHLEDPQAPKTRDLLRALQVTGKFESPYALGTERKYIEENSAEVYLFDALQCHFSSGNDALGIVRRK